MEVKKGEVIDEGGVAAGGEGMVVLVEHEVA